MTRIILNKVLSLTLMLMTLLAGPYPAQYKKMVFANGCFWGSEKGAWRLPGVFTSACGYCAGFTPNPTYEEACSGKSGHTEVKSSIWRCLDLFSRVLSGCWIDILEANAAESILSACAAKDISFRTPGFAHIAETSHNFPYPQLSI